MERMARSPSLDTLKYIAKRIKLSSSLILNDEWEPIPLPWLEKFEKYIEMAGDPSWHPGPIDGSSLEGIRKGILRKDIHEDVDYCLVQSSIVDTLSSTFGSSVRFKRRVVESSGRRYIQLDLVDFMVFFSTLRDPIPATEGKIVNYSDVRTLKDFQSHYYNARLWIRSNDDADSANEYCNADNERIITSSMLRKADGWMLVDNLDLKVEEILGDNEFLPILVEELENNSWPRDRFKKSIADILRVNDVLEVVRNQDHKPYLGVILELTEVDALVHFKTWSDECNERVPRFDWNHRMTYAFHHLTNWIEDLREDSMLDIKVALVNDKESLSYWIQGLVEEIDHVHGEILVSYDYGLVRSMHERSVSNLHLPTMTKPQTSSSLYDIDDDENADCGSSSSSITSVFRSDYSYDRYSSSSSYSSNASFLKSTFPTEYQEAWYKLNGESISKLHSHSIRTYESNAYEREEYESNRFGSSSGGIGLDRLVKGHPPAAGMVGLSNLGNTCYMNSMIQCLSHSQLLREIFLSNRYRRDLNRQNPVGNGGKVAKMYAQLMKDIWSNEYVTIAPKKFKTLIGSCWTQFSGYDQQDSQELMGSILDGLHEDLNRVKKKPYVTTVTSNNRPDELISRESWRRHLLRHDSALLDVCYGQTKSLVTCRSCGQESVTFEAFNCLSLPIPVKKTMQSISLIICLLDTPSMLSLELQYEADWNVRRILEEMNKLLSKSSLVSIPTHDDHHDDHHDDQKDAWMKIYGRYWEVFALRDERDYFSSTAMSSLHFSACLSKPYSILHVFEVAHDEKASFSCHFHSCIPTYHTSSVSWSVESTFGAFPVRLQSSSALTMCDLFEEAKRVAKTILEPHWSFIMEHFSRNDNGNGDHGDLNSDGDMDIDVDDALLELFELYSLRTSYCYRVSNEDKLSRSKEPWNNNNVKNIALMWRVDVFPWLKSCVFVEQKNLQRVDQDDDCNIDHSSHSFTRNNDHHYHRYYHPATAATSTSTSTSTSLTLMDCFQRFTEVEILPEAETFYCAKCKMHLAPKKKMDIWCAPDILILHLKRFRYSQGAFSVSREKVTDEIDYPLEGLDLSSIVRGVISQEAPPIYDLYAVSLHSGNLYGGHYTAYCKDENSPQWYLCNDSHVSPVDTKQIVSSQAYVLFYKRRHGKLRWGGIEPLREDEALPDE